MLSPPKAATASYCASRHWNQPGMSVHRVTGPSNRLPHTTSECESIESILFLFSGVGRLLRRVWTSHPWKASLDLAQPHPEPDPTIIRRREWSFRVSLVEMSQLRGRRASVRCGCGRE